jgi:hypothetical protein
MNPPGSGGSQGGVTGSGGHAGEAGSASLEAGGSNGAAAGSSGGLGGDAAGGASGGSGGSAGDPVLPTSCFYPTAPAPNPAVTDYRLGGSPLEAAFEPGCVFGLGAVVDLPLLPEDLDNVLFHYDVNGDGVEDLFIGGRDGGEQQSIRSYLSRADGGDVSFSAGVCELTLGAPVRSVFVRHLNADMIPDLVVGTQFGILVLLNLPDGLRGVGSLDFGDAADTSVALLDVAVGNWGTPGLRDVFVGFDAALGEGINLRMGVARFQARDGETEYTASTPLTTDILEPHEFGIESGYITGLPRADRTDMFSVLLERPGSLGWLWDEQGTTIVPTPPGVSENTSLARTARIGDTAALALGTDQDIAFYALPERPSDSPPAHLTTALMVFPAAGREFGGGARQHNRYLIDLDADGDDDIVELGSLGGGAPFELVFHEQTNQGFEPQAPLQTAPGRFATEDPFLTVNGRRGRIFVRAASLDDGGFHAASVQALTCAPR